MVVQVPGLVQLRLLAALLVLVAPLVGLVQLPPIRLNRQCQVSNTAWVCAKAQKLLVVTGLLLPTVAFSCL